MATQTTVPGDVTTTPVETKTPFDIAVDKIVAQTGCTPAKARVAIEFIQNMVTKARGGTRCNTPGTHHLTSTEMATTGYGIMDDIMPHGETAKPGSAHAAVEAVVLGSQDYAVVHDNPTGRAQDCVVAVQVRSVS